jgi:hypothetical protein
VPPARFATNDRFADPVLTETRARIAAWSGELSLTHATPSAAAFGLDAESWNEDAERSLYRLAVVATWVLRLGPAAAEAAWAHLEPAGVVDALYDGSAPDIAPAEVDPQALLWLSLLARRFAELPELAAELDRQTSAEEVFRTLDTALGRGLLGLELLWMLRELEAAGIVKRPGLAAFTALPDRAARDTLFRLGFLRTPYAPDGAALAVASAAVREAAGGRPRRGGPPARLRGRRRLRLRLRPAPPLRVRLPRARGRLSHRRRSSSIAASVVARRRSTASSALSPRRRSGRIGAPTWCTSLYGIGSGPSPSNNGRGRFLSVPSSLRPQAMPSFST